MSIKKLFFVLVFIFCVKIGFAQKNFEGEIDFKTFMLSDLKKDTAIGAPSKIIFGKHMIKVEKSTKEGVLWEEDIIFLDSLKEIVINHKSKEYWEGWRYNPDKTFPNVLPWGMNKVLIIHAKKNIAGHETYLMRLVNTDKTLNAGYAELNAANSLYFQLPPHIAKGLFMDGLLFFDNHIMLGIKLAAGVAPHTQIVNIATKIEARDIDSSEFTVPIDYKLIVIKNGPF